MSDADRRAAARSLAAAPSTIGGLHGAVKERLANISSLFVLDEKNEPRAPIIFDGWLPPKDATNEEQFPFLVLRPRAGTDSPQGADENASATIEIIIGTYSDTNDGWFDVLALIDAIRIDLGAAPTIDGSAFEQIGPLSWTIPEEQPRPQWFGTVTTIWQLPRPKRVESLNPEG